jgi:rod shape-determining protein MreC
VHDKTARRRRALLALLVGLSLLLLTAYFGEAHGGRLHSVQRAFLTVVTPIQDGANKALKPVRDLFGGISDTFHAKSQRNELRKQVDKLRQQLVADESEKRQYHELLGLYHLDQLGVGNYRPVSATVIDKSPNIWYETVTIDKGSADGVRRNDPVVNAEGLVGKVAEVIGDGAVVDLLTDSTMGVSARVSTGNATGIVQPKVGNPNALLLQYLPANTPVSPGEYVVTSGTVSSGGDSLYPPGIPIGQVTSINEESAFRSVNVHPLANLHNLDVVQVLTSSGGGRPASLAGLAATLPPGQGTGNNATAEALASTGTGG